MVRVIDRSLVDDHVIKGHLARIVDLAIEQTGHTALDRETTSVIELAADLNITSRQRAHIQYRRHDLTNIATSEVWNQGRKNTANRRTTRNRHITGVANNRVESAIFILGTNSDQGINNKVLFNLTGNRRVVDAIR